MHRGYIKLWRSSVENKLYFAEPFTKWQAWQDLLILTNHRDSTTVIRGIIVPVKRGQVLAGEQFLADRWQWSRGKVRRFLQQLEGKTVQQIVQQKSTLITIITIVNWEFYQSNDTTDGTANGTTNSTTDGQQTDTLKNNNNDKNTSSSPPVVPQENIFTLYEFNIGLITPMMADQLRDAEKEYPFEWVKDAFQEAVDHNKRSWAYVEAVLRAWQKNGRNGGKPPSGRIPADGKYHTIEELVGHHEPEESEVQS